MRSIRLAFVSLLAFIGICAAPAFAQDWTSGQRPIVYTDAHPLGDGVTNTRGGEAPYFASEPDDIPTDPTLLATWTQTCTSVTVCGGNSVHTGAYENAAGNNGYPAGSESKGRFDCNDAFDENSDPILKPGQSGTNLHDHHFFGNLAAAGNMASVNYAWLRTHGNSTCYGGPTFRTLYWEPTLYSLVNGVLISHKAGNIVTYYKCGNLTTDPPKCTRWPRGIAIIFGKDFNDPANTRGQNHIAASTAVTPPNAFSIQSDYYRNNGFHGWRCQYSATPDYTAYAPNQVQGSFQPYLNDRAGHATLSCLDNTAAGVPTAYNLAHGIQIYADLESPECWDGYNPRSPNGRDHMAYLIAWTDGGGYCPDHWYRTVQFEPKINFVLKDATELATVVLSSDQMPGMNLTNFTGSISGTTLTVPSIAADISHHSLTGAGIPAGTTITTCTGSPITSCTLSANLGTISPEAIIVPYNGGETMHADLIPAQDYGTGDHPGLFVTMMRECDGISMHLKNSDGVTYTDLVGTPHECAYGRVGANWQTYNDVASPDGSSPNPVVDLNPDLSGPRRFFPITNGTPLRSTVLHQKH